jgi:hypothetical protein
MNALPEHRLIFQEASPGIPELIDPTRPEVIAETHGKLATLSSEIAPVPTPSTETPLASVLPSTTVHQAAEIAGKTALTFLNLGLLTAIFGTGVYMLTSGKSPQWIKNLTGQKK